MRILGSRNSSKRNKTNNFKTPPLVINLEEENDEDTVDLMENEGDPEIIVLDDSIRCTNRDMITDCSVVDLCGINEFSKTPEKSKASESDIEILSVKIFEPQTLPIQSTSNSEMKKIDNMKLKKGRKRKNKKANRKMSINKKSITRALSNSSGSLFSSTDSLPQKKKKRKLLDISNTRFTDCIASPSLVQSSGLSENTLKYYKNISVVVGRAENERKISLTRKNSSVRRSLENNAKKKNKSPTRKISPYLERRLMKRKVFTPQKNLRHKSSNHQKRLLQRSLTNQNSPRSVQFPQGGTSNRISKRRMCDSTETNAFNPNPYDVDLEGLRPVIIDGCNVAIGHGKGIFSPKGLKICVDYFAARGHTKIKVFLPQFRQEEFTGDQLEELKTKCDVVFTPSQNINGQRRTPYDDRFIVQYATEFSGVIVSTDNYRDLIKENPRWQQTIEKRLLMFTWVDDFLMFPVDPLGRSGPTLEEFLRF